MVHLTSFVSLPSRTDYDEDSSASNQEDMDLEDQMAENQPKSVIPEGLYEADQWKEFRKLFTDDQFNYLYKFLVEEENRGGEKAQRLFYNFCVWGDENLFLDPYHRDFPTLVTAAIEDAAKRAETLITNQEIARNGGNKASLISAEEMVQQRKALFKPVVGAQKKEKKPPRENPGRDEAVKKARSKNNSTSTDD